MAYADTLLAEGEHVVYRTKQHPLGRLFASRWGIVAAGIGLALLVLLAFFGPGAGLARDLLGWAMFLCLVVGGALIGWNYVAWYQEDYLITSRRVMKVGGILNKKSMDSSLEKINDAILSQGLVARILKYGDLDIMTAADEAIDKYEMLAHAVDFKKAMLNAKNDLEDGGRGVSSASRPAGRASAEVSSDVEAALDRLAALRDKGKITGHRTQKADLLDKMWPVRRLRAGG
jgi:uncharacterized membrane protein YdbT with pleckstrin-like domain